MKRNYNTCCIVCNKLFYKRPNQKTPLNHDFCSRKCFSFWRIKDKKERICLICGSSFNYKRKDQLFCSISCSAKRRRIDMWNGRGKNKSEQLKIYFLSLGWDGCCMIEECDYKKTLDNHRILNGVDGGDYNKDNVSIICPNHHQEIHRLNYKIVNIDKFKFCLVPPEVP